MPKIVDHEQRREEVLEATWRVISRVGIEGTTIRAIADEVGYSPGVLAHYFANKDDIVVSAHLLAYDRAGTRMEAVTRSHSGMDALRLVVREALPLDEARLLEAKIEMNAWHSSMTNDKLAQIKSKSLQRWRNALGDLVTEARSLDELTSPLADELVVHEIIMLIDGLSAQAVIHPEYATPARQLELADALLDRLATDRPPGGK